MIKRTYTFIVFVILIVHQSFGQYAPAPEYLTKQDFPDSVANLQMLALDGKNIAFSEVLALHKGKKVVIDFWASWCKDCIVGLPELKKLKKKTTKNNVAYVFISLDKEDAKWRSAINRFNISGEHYRIAAGWKNALSHYIGLDWIPRYMVLNKKGRIIMPKAVTANNKALKRSLLD